MVIGDAQVKGALGKLAQTLIPGFFQIGGRRAVEQDLVERGQQRPGIVNIEGLEQQLGFAGFGQHDDVRLGLHQLDPRLLPEARGHGGGHVAPETIQIESGWIGPVFEHGDHVFAEFGIFVVQTCHVCPFGHGRNDFAIAVLLVELRMLHHHAVPGGVVGHDV